MRPPRTGHASLNPVAAAESERLTRLVVRPKICTDELCRVVRNSTSKRDPKRKFKLTDGHADCFARARICVCVCVCVCQTTVVLFPATRTSAKYLRGKSHVFYSSSDCPGTRPSLSVGNTRRYCWLGNPSIQ